jgi:type II secretory pathway pseudopilin PulG
MTLLELILALALAALLLMAISMALQIHWRAFDVRRSRVEEAQLARAILRSIADDLRSTIKSEPPDLSGLSFASALPTSNPSTNPTTDPTTNPPTNPTTNPPTNPTTNPPTNPTTNPPTNPTTNPPTNPTTNPPTNPTTNPTTNPDPAATPEDGDMSSGGQSTGDMPAESGPSVVVGLYGTATQLQFDISRLPRVDQYQALSSADGSAVEIPSDIKTIVYFLQSEESAAASSSPLAGAGAGVEASTSSIGRGLLRAESDRAVSAWGEMNGSTQSIYGGAKMLAPEVTSLEFQYFDGTGWVPEWNSDEMGGLPVAIEVLLTIAPPTSASAADPTLAPLGASATGESSGKVYRMVVHLPVGGVSPATEEPAETTESTETPPTTTP